MKRTALKRTTPLKAKKKSDCKGNGFLMKRTALKPISDKQRGKSKHWKEVTDQKAKDLGYICQWCGSSGSRTTDNPWYHLDGHHIEKRRCNIHTYENCYVCHNQPCHLSEIEGKNIDVRVYPNKKIWESAECQSDK